jgi:hypothetical protein
MSDDWFDDAAKRAAGGSGTERSRRVTRRGALKRGAVIGTAAWTAPLILSSTAHAAGISQCTTVVCGTAPNQVCCPAGDPCTNNTCCATLVCSGMCCPDPGQATACNNGICPGELGGLCKNQGAGASGCRVNSTKCNNQTPNICGGPGSKCVSNADCVSGMCNVGQGQGNNFCT